MSRMIVTRVLFSLAAAVFAGQSIGCNTTAGVGEDMQEAGRGIERAAERNK